MCKILQVGNDEDLLPHSPGDVKCVLRISSTTAADTDIETWYHLWEATVALNAMCVRVGKRGSASRLG